MTVEDLYRLLRTGHVQAQGIVDTVGDPLLVLDASLCVQHASRSFFETFKVDRDATIGRPIYDLGDGQWDIPALRTLLAEVIPNSTAVINYRVDHDFPDIGPRTMLVTARTLFHPDGQSHTMLVSLADATEQSQLDVARDMLFGELRHRMKNLLAVVHSLARRTPVEGVSAKEYRDTFLGRFEALAEAQDLAFAEQSDAGLLQLLERALAPYDVPPGCISIKAGPTVDLGPRTIMSLGLVIHELATNAAKHGALSVPTGKLQVGWSVDDNTQFRLHWREIDGPPATAPTKSGYGTQLIDVTVKHNLSGTLERHYRSGGFEVEIVIPLGTASPTY